MSAKASKARPATSSVPPKTKQKEPWPEQIASFVGFFVYLLILKTFFLPLFIIPTGSMAETLYGAHAIHTCPNCGLEYPVGWQPQGVRSSQAYHPVIQCPNCRWRAYYGEAHALDPQRAQPDGLLSRPLRSAAGDRIFVHGWLFDRPLAGIEGLGPARWDVVVFKVPTDGETNYIKRLLGLPGETLELIDGDVFINGKLEQKTADAQRSLWFPYYDHDHPPKETSRHARYHPRWVALDERGPWSGLGTRVVRFDGLDGSRSEIQFGSDPLDPLPPGLVQDVYAYNEPHPHSRLHAVTDVRLSAEVEFTEARQGGYVEFSTSKAEHHFYARLTADGRLTLQHRLHDDTRRETWGEYQLPQRKGPVRIALSHMDGVVAVEVNGRAVPVLRSSRAQYRITPELARAQSQTNEPPVLRIAAEKVQVVLRHVLIERDVYYTSDIGVRRREDSVYGVQGHPIRLGPNDYFLLGDNSPNSQDARYSFAGRGTDPVGPHLKEAEARGTYQRGTVPRDQLIGRAFFVYWPGFMPLTPWGPDFLPDLGRARWIR